MIVYTSLKCVFVLCVISKTVTSFQIKSLNGDNWLLKDSKNEHVGLKATVPGGIYTDLMNNKIIEDIFFGFNENDVKWVPRQNWIYYTNFTVNKRLLDHGEINMVFDGLDTFSTILLNNVEIGKSRNMFVQYVFNIKRLLKEGINSLEVRFESPVEVADKLSKNQTYDIPPLCPPREYNGECHVNQIRKMQASFAWDWGPSFPSVGIWKNVSIEAFSEFKIRYVVPQVIDLNKDQWQVSVDVYFSNYVQITRGKLLTSLELHDRVLEQMHDVHVERNDLEDTVQYNYSFIVEKTLVEMWWPNGYGSQKLYNLKLQFSSDEVLVKKIGFKSVELVQEKIENGISFYFKINGIPIFMKGSNEIPLDILPENGQNKEKIRTILETARDSHMNMLRVWGGGVYESEYFYETADELGILIWQDFMFACALYPVQETFLENVLEEVRHQVRRLAGHTSIVLFAGNNENEAAISQNWYNLQNKIEKYKQEYVTLYIDTIKKEYDRLTNNRGIFLTSSPTNGKESDNENYISKTPGSSLFGDVHFYNYIFDGFNSNIYPIPRFASEFGYQSFPSLNSLKKVTNTSADLKIDGKFLQLRQHHPGGNLEIEKLISDQFVLPNPSTGNFDRAVIFYSQILHAMSTKIEAEHYRRYRSIVDQQGQGRTMGALYWQLNDVWIAPTWSGIDYFGKWKMLQYYVKEFFSPVIVTGHINVERQLEIYSVSDLTHLIKNATFVLNIYKWDSFLPIKTTNQTLDVESGSSKLIQTLDLDTYLSNSGCGSLQNSRNICFLHIVLQKNNLNISPDNFVFPGKIRDSGITNPNIFINNVLSLSDGSFKITITSDKIALFVWLEAEDIDGEFSENGFIHFTKTRIVYFNSKRNITSNELKEKLTITNLMDKNYM